MAGKPGRSGGGWGGCRHAGLWANDKTLEVDAAEIRIRAERRLGEMLAAQKGVVSENGKNRTLSRLQWP